MATITEDYVSFEIAKLLKEKGFNEPCHACYAYFSDDDICVIDLKYSKAAQSLSEDRYPCVSIYVAMKWLREVHNIHIVIKIVIRTYGDTEYYYELYGTKNKSLCVVCDIYKGESWDNNEEACESAIKYCLEHLI